MFSTGVGASFFGEILQPQGGVGGVGALPGANGGTGNGTGPGGKLVSVKSYNTIKMYQILDGYQLSL